jgi:hypothetical protein
MCRGPTLYGDCVDVVCARMLYMQVLLTAILPGWIIMVILACFKKGFMHYYTYKTTRVFLIFNHECEHGCDIFCCLLLSTLLHYFHQISKKRSEMFFDVECFIHLIFSSNHRTC